ncbi:CbtA family protein [Actinoplanes sp. CA-015351]|uniref:CbtA family protein n=1 Tax=Actinoplanes sp. CA-015351 TaxID=3239897 RepID=UPI003D98BC58
MPLTSAPAPTYGRLLINGLLAGLIAGLLAGGFAFFVGEPHVDAAIALEEAAAVAAGDTGGGEEPLVARDVQSGFGLILATSLYGIALGGMFATGYTVLRRRLHAASDARASLGLAGAVLLGFVLVPFVKYPPNPPAVGDPATINQRTITYLAMVVIGLVAVWAGVLAARTQAPEWRKALAGVAGFVVVVAIGYALLPSFDEVPETFPATLLWDFRLSSLGTQVVLWTVLGLAFTALLARAGAPAAAAKAEPVTASAAG